MAELSVSEYDLAEQKAISELPNRVIEAFHPVLFQEVGYPTRVRNEAELWKYVDVMHDLRFEKDYSDLLGGLTENEFALLKKLSEQICGFSDINFKQKIVARSSVLRSMNVLRHIRYLFGNERPRVFEIGPGCGYLGAMLLLDGSPYASTDITQSLYMYQNKFWNFISDGGVIDLAGEGKGGALPDIPVGGSIHVPWWEFVKLRPESVPQFDMVTCNHALAEMHHDSLRFSIKLAASFLRTPGKKKAFVFEGWGWERNTSRAFITDVFYQSNFVLVHSDPWITVFAPKGSNNADYHFPPRAAWRGQWRNALRYSVGLPFLESLQYKVKSYKSRQNPISSAVMDGRESQLNARTVKISEVQDFYTGLLGRSDHLTQDEQFGKLIERPLV